jgi:phage tail-like protein
MALLSRTALRGDPVLNHNFVVQLLDSGGDARPVGVVADLLNAVVGGFSECLGIEMTMKVEEFNEGGRNGEVLKFPGRVSWTNITLKKGIASGTALWDWYYSFIEGRGKRKDGLIILLNEQHLPNNVWQFRRGIPLKYTGPSLNATQNNVAIESIEIAHEGIFQVPGIGIGAAAVGTAAGLLG